MESKRFVYILRSDTYADRHYVGLTSDVDRRLAWHNTGPSGVTVHHRPWSVVVSPEFADATSARRFERYLKTGSGRAFAKRHFGPTTGDSPESGSRSRTAC
jgi:predicted GIY-YIG superfamily endonuclease